MADDGENFFLTYFGSEEDDMYKNAFSQVTNIEEKVPAYMNSEPSCAEDFDVPWSSMSIQKYKTFIQFTG